MVRDVMAPYVYIIIYLLESHYCVNIAIYFIISIEYIVFFSYLKRFIYKNLFVVILNQYIFYAKLLPYDSACLSQSLINMHSFIFLTLSSSNANISMYVILFLALLSEA